MLDWGGAVHSCKHYIPLPSGTVPRPPSASIVPTTVTTLWRLGPTIKECLTSSGHRSTILWVAETLPITMWR